MLIYTYSGETATRKDVSMQTETILKMHLGKAYKTWQDSKMEAEFYCEGYDVVQTEQYCYDTLALACKDIGIELTDDEKDAIKKELVEKWDEIKRKDAEKWELKEKYFNGVIVPHVESYKKGKKLAEKYHLNIIDALKIEN